MPLLFAELEKDNSSPSLVPIIVTLTVVMAVFTLAVTIISLYYKNRKQQRTNVRRELEMPQYAEILSDAKEINSPKTSECYDVIRESKEYVASSQLPPMKMGENVP